jgi:hypothetical protein
VSHILKPLRRTYGHSSRSRPLRCGPARYGFDLAAYAVGWVPYVGWLAPQITIFYNFGERIARSITYNTAYWLDGNISFGQGLANVGVDTVNAVIQLGIDQWNFWLWRRTRRSSRQASARTRRLSTNAGGSAPNTISSNGAYSTTPPPPNGMSSPGPPNVSPATVSSQHHSGSAATRGEDVHCVAAHTSAALTRPLMSALIGNATDPIRT